MNRPNIVFLSVDQMHRDALSGYGQQSAKTPALDRIASEGYSFMRSYTTMPQCVPARTSWFTGRMSKEHGAPTNAFGLDPTIPDLGQWLRDKGGYETVYAGKWDVNNRDVRKSCHLLADGVGGGMGAGLDAELTRSVLSFLRLKWEGNRLYPDAKAADIFDRPGQAWRIEQAQG